MKNRFFYLSFCLFIFLLFKDINPILTFICLNIYWYLIFKDYTFIILFTFLLLIIPIDNNYNTNSGRIIDINTNSIIISNSDNQKLFLVTPTDTLNYDDTISFKCEIKSIKKNKTFNGFDFKKYYNNNKIYNQCFTKDVKIIKKGSSLKNKLYSYINNINNENIKKYYNKLFFNYKSNDIPDIFLKTGMQFNGLLIFIYSILKFFLYDKQIIKIQILITLLFILIFGFEIVLIRILLSKLLKFSKLDKYNQLGLQICIMYFIFPSHFLDLSLIYPFTFSIINCFYYDKSKYLFKLFSMLIQSYFFYSFNIIHILLFNIMIVLYGFIFLLSIIFLPIINYSNIIFIVFEIIIKHLNFNYFNINGQFNIYIILILIIFYIKCKSIKLLPIIFIITMYFNIFNPFTKITFINVGQGDSILIQNSFNQNVILYDTGKSSAYNNLDSYLQANGIDKIDRLIISHNDSDHNGNVDRLMNEYNIGQLILEKQDVKLNNLFLKNIYLGKYDNDNDNSLIYLLSINNLNILLTGDISKMVEEYIVDKYPLLNVDILKVSHHGSNTSSSPKFIQSIKPKLAIISSGTTYNHPSKEVVQLFDDNNILHLDTKDVGDIVITFTKYLNIINTSENQFGIIN